MAVFKCKMCGGTIEFEPGATVGVCDSCGTRQTLPKSNDEVIENLFARANNLRLKCEFDKAEAIYEKIVELDNTESEAHWGIVLCKYGIEYVEDPKTFKRVPTCHRTLLEAVLCDADYLATLENADAAQRGYYEKEANLIDSIQKDILAIVHKEKPFDVFICYKETDENGNRTQDSVIANDIYYELTQEGFKVFYSAITLEDKLGQEYEPYIYAALHSAKVMLVVGTKPLYFDAVWVRNEWSRFLKLMKTDRSRLLIPCYKDMDAYELPDEFAHLQAQDMGKIGFINDIVRGIKKVVSKEGSKAAVKGTVIVDNTAGVSANVKPLIERTEVFLEDGDWEQAAVYADRVLDLEPKNAYGYLLKLLAAKHISKKDDLKNCERTFTGNRDYQRFKRYASPEFVAEIEGYNSTIAERNETARLNGIYNDAVLDMNKATFEIEYKIVAEKFKTISGFKDADELAEKCLEKADYIHCEVEHEVAQIRPTIEQYSNSIDQINTQILAKKAELSRLGIFKISERKAIISEISNLQKKLEVEIKNKDSIIAGLPIEKQISLGNVLYFGNYYGIIEWQVLAKEGTKILVISKYALDCKPYDTSYAGETWETSTLRAWLNEAFYNISFSSSEQKKIITTKVSADMNPDYSTDPGKATNDKVFLLSITEVNKYFSSDEARMCVPTAYAVAQGAYTSSSDTEDGEVTCWWWLRSPGFSQANAAGISSGGSVDLDGHGVNYVSDAVRPAMWIDWNVK